MQMVDEGKSGRGDNLLGDGAGERGERPYHKPLDCTVVDSVKLYLPAQLSPLLHGTPNLYRTTLSIGTPLRVYRRLCASDVLRGKVHNRALK